ncbi:unnamed protein product, partial [Closterium sp. Naga37s-1]
YTSAAVELPPWEVVLHRDLLASAARLPACKPPVVVTLRPHHCPATATAAGAAAGSAPGSGSSRAYSECCRRLMGSDAAGSITTCSSTTGGAKAGAAVAALGTDTGVVDRAPGSGDSFSGTGGVTGRVAASGSAGLNGDGGVNDGGLFFSWQGFAAPGASVSGVAVSGPPMSGATVSRAAVGGAAFMPGSGSKQQVQGGVAAVRGDTAGLAGPVCPGVEAGGREVGEKEAGKAREGVMRGEGCAADAAGDSCGPASVRSPRRDSSAAAGAGGESGLSSAAALAAAAAAAAAEGSGGEAAQCGASLVHVDVRFACNLHVCYPLLLTALSQAVQGVGVEPSPSLQPDWLSEGNKGMGGNQGAELQQQQQQQQQQGGASVKSPVCMCMPLLTWTARPAGCTLGMTSLLLPTGPAWQDTLSAAIAAAAAAAAEAASAQATARLAEAGAAPGTRGGEGGGRGAEMDGADVGEAATGGASTTRRGRHGRSGSSSSRGGSGGGGSGSSSLRLGVGMGGMRGSASALSLSSLWRWSGQQGSGRRGSSGIWSPQGAYGTQGDGSTGSTCSGGSAQGGFSWGRGGFSVWEEEEVGVDRREGGGSALESQKEDTPELLAPSITTPVGDGGVDSRQGRVGEGGVVAAGAAVGGGRG